MKTVDREKLWESYQKNPVSEIREQIIIEYAPLVKLVAGRLSMYLGYNVEYEDLVSYGIFGLIDAIDKFDRSKDVKFETYASLRIRGAILDDKVRREIALQYTVYHIRPPGVKQKGCRTRKEYGSLDGFFDVLRRDAFYSAALKL